MELKLVGTDNRDSRSTVLVMGEVDKLGKVKPGIAFTVEVDPIDLCLNMIQNLPVPLDERFEWSFNVFMNTLEAELELNTEDQPVKMPELDKAVEEYCSDRDSNELGVSEGNARTLIEDFVTYLRNRD